MIGFRALLVLVLSLCCLSACSDDDKPNTDAGTGGDSGGAKDAGGDGALTWNPDTGVGTGDAGGIDSSVPANCGNSTRDFFFAIPTTLCTAKTHECVLACEDDSVTDKDECRGTCIAADKHPMDPAAPWAKCDSCVYSQLFECGHTSGCEAAVEAFFCCAETKCPSGSPDGCTDTMCDSESMDAIVCIYNAAPDCLAYDKPFISACFETVDEDDAGVTDAGN